MVDRYNSRGYAKSVNGTANFSSNNSNRNGNCGCSQNDFVRMQSGCGCTQNNSDECKKLIKKLQEIDFSLIETVLYLDVYPECGEALAYYHKLKAERKSVAEALEKSCNSPLTSFENRSTYEWNWTDSPWPWEPDAN